MEPRGFTTHTVDYWSLLVACAQHVPVGSGIIPGLVPLSGIGRGWRYQCLDYKACVVWITEPASRYATRPARLFENRQQARYCKIRAVAREFFDSTREQQNC